MTIAGSAFPRDDAKGSFYRLSQKIAGKRLRDNKMEPPQRYSPHSIRLCQHDNDAWRTLGLIGGQLKRLGPVLVVQCQVETGLMANGSRFTYRRRRGHPESIRFKNSRCTPCDDGTIAQEERRKG